MKLAGLHGALLLAGSLALVTPTASAQASSPRPELSRLNLGKGGLALQGYDPVAYFPFGGGVATKGSPEITATYRGVTYRFANDEDRVKFLLDPDRYEPAYGGWCAWAMSDDDRVEIDPESFLIQDGELLVFYNGFFANTRKKWMKGDVDALKVKADANWRKYYGHPDRDLSRIHLEDGVGLGGYDPVGYFSDPPQALPGSASITETYRGVTYRFASKDHVARFLERPYDFEPRLGGFDPVALAKGERTPGSPELFAIVAGKLYLFADEASRSTFATDAVGTANRAEDLYRGYPVPPLQEEAKPAEAGAGKDG